jgi:hypothetical protein
VFERVWPRRAPADGGSCCRAALDGRLHGRVGARVPRRRYPEQGLSDRAVIVPDIDKKPFEAAMTGIYARPQHDPASAQLIERIRKVE